MTDSFDNSNPFIHGTSSQTLILMQRTDFMLMPIITMLNKYKIAPIVGELTKGGFAQIGHGANDDTFIGAPAFGRLRHQNYDLGRVISEYTCYSEPLGADTCIKKFKNLLKNSHKSAFTDLNLLMIYLVRARQLGVKIQDLATADELYTLEQRLDATVQFYYFILCVQKYIFINPDEIKKFVDENNLHNNSEILDYLKHYFSFESLLEKFINTKFDVKIFYESQGKNIDKLLDFIKISRNSEAIIKRYGRPDESFIANGDYNFFTKHKYQHAKNIRYFDLNHLIFSNESSWGFDTYIEKYCRGFYSQGSDIVLPNFEKFHDEILKHINAMSCRIQLCKTLLKANDSEFIPYNTKDELFTNPFPIVFVSKAEAILPYTNEYRSKTPLKLGKDIMLVATNNKSNQKRLRDYLQNNSIGPVEVILFKDLKTISLNPKGNYFDSLANDDIKLAFDLAKKQNCLPKFCKLYRSLSELNEKRFRFKSTNPLIHKKLTDLFESLQNTILPDTKNKINFPGIKNAILINKQENYQLYATHRGILGVIDTLLTILLSMVIFYPIIYLIQKNQQSMHTFFATDTEEKVNHTANIVDEILNDVDDLKKLDVS